jgi:hypothetical protein
MDVKSRVSLPSQSHNAFTLNWLSFNRSSTNDYECAISHPLVSLSLLFNNTFKSGQGYCQSTPHQAWPVRSDGFREKRLFPGETLCLLFDALARLDFAYLPVSPD